MLRKGDRTLKASPGLPRRAGLFFADWNAWIVFPRSSFRDAPLGAGPESIVTIVVMDSGLARFAPAPE